MNFWVIFRYIWMEIIFLEGLVKLKEIRNVEDLVVLKLEFAVNKTDTKLVH